MVTIHCFLARIFCRSSSNLLLLLLFSGPVMSNLLWSHGLQHTRPPCPSPSPRVCSNSCPLNRWCYPTISSSIIHFASLSVLPMNLQDWFPLGRTDLISLLSKGLSKVFFNTTVWKYQFFGAQPSLWSNFHIHTTTGKTITLTVQIFVAKWCFCFLAHYVCHSFPSKNKRLSISLLQSPF